MASGMMSLDVMLLGGILGLSRMPGMLLSVLHPHILSPNHLYCGDSEFRGAMLIGRSVSAHHHVAALLDAILLRAPLPGSQ